MSGSPTTYAIRVDGHLDDHWAARLGDADLVRDDAGSTTVTVAVADQAQLHGVLAGLRDIGAVLTDLRVAAPGPSPEPVAPRGRPVQSGRVTAEDRLPALVRWTRAIEEAEPLDGAVRALEPVVDAAFASGTKGEVLRGEWLGHAVHPVLTDLVLGIWTSATVLDLVGGRESRKAAQRLVGLSLLAVGPTAWTGWAEWAGAGPRDKRVGVVHAVTNAVAIGAYASSWLARRRGDHGTGVRRAMAGAAVASVGGYLGSHLAAARKVGSHHPAYD